MSQVYRRIEDWHGIPDVKYRGVAGPVYLQTPQDRHPLYEAMLAGAESCGIPRFESTGGRMMESEGGPSFVDEIVHRRSIFRSYVHPLTDQPNLTMLTGALVTRVVFEKKRAIGVELRYGGRSLRVDATHEVILSRGTIQNPKLLMQSGIGDEVELAKFRIPLIEPLPGVGRIST